MFFFSRKARSTVVDFQCRLAWAMARAKVSASVLANHLGVSYQAIRKVELGASKAMTAANNELTASFLGVNSCWLATGVGPRLPAERPLADVSQWPFRTFTRAEWVGMPQDSRLLLEVQIRAVIDSFADAQNAIGHVHKRIVAKCKPEDF